MNEREQHLYAMNSMKPGQCYALDRDTFDRVFAVRPLSEHRTPEENCLSGLVGSAYGSFLVTRDLMTGNVTVSRHETNEQDIVYVEADRRHLYRKNRKGHYTLIERKPKV